MSASPITRRVEDDVPRYNDEVAVGEDLEFQRKWWKFENAVWVFFGIIIVCDVLGVFGRGWLAKAQATTPDRAVVLSYERMERAFTPSILDLEISQNAIRDGKVTVFVSGSVVKDLGAARISPQPLTSTIGNDGYTYVFPATTSPATIQIALSPPSAGLRHFRVQVAGSEAIEASVFVFP
ncbi:hypothetical protein [Occallatibacter savannae]|uniref:hypothetical protein n=1 Tax=Occallatibacter savannae TaxID=1002691 RepID=UPI000D687F26|nr:hypothetical protein [Occallatibacter savannae]